MALAGKTGTGGPPDWEAGAGAKVAEMTYQTHFYGGNTSCLACLTRGPHGGVSNSLIRVFYTGFLEKMRNHGRSSKEHM